MNQISATFIKVLKDTFRNKSSLFWVIAWPAIWLLLAVFVFLRQVPPEFAGRLVIPQTIIEKVTIEIVLCPFAKAANSGGTWRKKTNTARNSQITGQAITQKSADLFLKVSFRTFINVADI